jgi:hypothetical protein
LLASFRSGETPVDPLWSNLSASRSLPGNHRNLLISGDGKPHWTKRPNKFYILLTLENPNWHEACTVLGHFSRSVPACGFCCVARLAQVRGSSKQ